MLPELASVRITAYEEGGKFIGHRVLPVIGLCPGYRHVNLRNEMGQPLLLATLFLCIVVKDYVPDGLSDFAEALANPIKYQSELEKRAEQLAVLTEDMEPIPEDDSVCESVDDAAVAKQSKADTLPFRQHGASEGLSDSGAQSAEAASRATELLAVSASQQQQGNSMSALASHGACGVGSSGAESGSSAVSMGGVTTAATSSVAGQQSTAEATTVTTAPTKSLEAIEADALTAETLESILANKCVREKRQEMEKKLESLRKKHDKEKLRVCSGLKSGESSSDKKSKFNMGNKLVKRLSNKSM